MSKNVASIVAGILSSNRMFSVGDGDVWLPFSEDVFDVCKHLEKALTLHGYDASFTNTRHNCGVRIKVDGAVELGYEECRRAISENYGYIGRIAGLQTENQRFEVPPFEPGTILEIPAAGWIGSDARVVIGRDAGTYLAKVHTTDIETYPGDHIPLPDSRERQKATLRELADGAQVIVKHREWSGYPQQSY